MGSEVLTRDASGGHGGGAQEPGIFAERGLEGLIRAAASRPEEQEREEKKIRKVMGLEREE